MLRWQWQLQWNADIFWDDFIQLFSSPPNSLFSLIWRYFRYHNALSSDHNFWFWGVVLSINGSRQQPGHTMDFLSWAVEDCLCMLRSATSSGLSLVVVFWPGVKTDMLIIPSSPCLHYNKSHVFTSAGLVNWFHCDCGAVPHSFG